MQVLGPKYNIKMQTLPLHKLTLVALRSLATNEPYSSIGDQFDLSERKTVKCLLTFCNLVKKHLAHQIEWPVGKEATRVISGFRALAGFPGVIGALGATHVVFQDLTPIEFSTDTYINRRGERSVALLLAVNHEMEITFYHGGEAGNAQEASMLFDSRLVEFFPTISGEAHLIASAEFPQHSWLLTPYVLDGDFSWRQACYNLRLNRTLALFRRANSVLKMKFPRLKDVGLMKILQVCDIAHATCILYNICLASSDLSLEFEEEYFPIGKLFRSGGDELASAKRESFSVYFQLDL